jgi:predicted nicotinamide N-methyase
VARVNLEAVRRRLGSAIIGKPQGPDPAPRQIGPASTSAPGSRRVEDGFFDRFAGFLETSETSSYRWRLNLRHEAIFTENRDLFAGARVLDIASHDGRWSMAALEAGAAHVTGVEARPDLVANAEASLRAYGVDESRWRFVSGDIFEVLRDEQVEVDVVLCLGFLYHTLRHSELLARIRQTGAKHLVVDTEIHRSEAPVMWLDEETIERQGNAVADELSVGDVVLTGRPSLSALEMLGRGQGFAMQGLSDWGGLLRDNPDADQVRDYRIGRRITCRLDRT